MFKFKQKMFLNKCINNILILYKILKYILDLIFNRLLNDNFNIFYNTVLCYLKLFNGNVIIKVPVF